MHIYSMCTYCVNVERRLTAAVYCSAVGFRRIDLLHDDYFYFTQLFTMVPKRSFFSPLLWILRLSFAEMSTSQPPKRQKSVQIERHMFCRMTVEQRKHEELNWWKWSGFHNCCRFALNLCSVNESEMATQGCSGAWLILFSMQKLAIHNYFQKD